ncbi:MAG: MOSC domain-containing protein [Deltaproteobacteria bacterium]|nr:MOSC domain-containing protein [Deltaproteobacteria bacterium]MBW2051189.1 MOSC domain-containing protein [Deltaproteobacteria bacterium]MBW2139830.1 MOSC domain-containing protein [Deltaproteobacteria bacterium]
MKVIAVSTSKTTGVKKTNVPSARLIINHGLEGDAHAGDWHRQVSLLAEESIDKMRAEGLDLAPGDFAENVTTEGIDLASLEIGTQIRIGAESVLELTQIGKECHTGCAIRKAVGKCVMPTEGVFFKVITPGEIKPGDEIVIC